MDLTPLYKVEMIEKNGTHNYSIDGNTTYFPGATTISESLSKPFIPPWVAKQTSLYVQKKLRQVALKNKLTRGFINRLFTRAKKQHRFIKEKAGDDGHEVHHCIHLLSQSKEVPPDLYKKHEVAIENYRGWRLVSGLKSIGAEIPVASRKYGFGGTIDDIDVDEYFRIVIVDYKTSSMVGESHIYQVSAYAFAAQETFGLDYLPSCRILRLDKKKPGKYDYYSVLNTGKNFDNFLHLLKIFQDKQRIKMEEIHA